jgi:hypothetical protein
MADTVARRPPRAASKWFPEGYYSMHADKALEHIGTSTSLTPDFRLYFICASRANVWGYAAFMQGEMRELLGCSERTRQRALHSLRSARIAAPELTHLCVVLSASVWRRGGRFTQTCIEPGHLQRQRLMWTPDTGWETEQGDWHKLVTHPASAAIIRQRRRTRTTRVVVEETETVAQIFPECEHCGQRHPESWHDPWAKTCRDPASNPAEALPHPAEARPYMTDQIALTSNDA